MIIQQLDGFKHGFMCYIKETEKCLLDKEGNKIFDNMEIMKLQIMKNHLKHRDYTILFTFMYNGKREAVKYSEIVKLDNGWFFFYFNGERISFRENDPRYVVGCGYFISQDGDVNMTIDRKKGMKDYRDFSGHLIGISKNLVLYPKLHMIIKKKSWKKFTIGFTDNTTRITFLERDTMLKQNTDRIKKGKKVFAFIKNMDRYKTIYFYITTNKEETLNPKIGYDTVEYILHNMELLYPNHQTRITRIDIKCPYEL